MDFKILTPNTVPMKTLEKASATVIEQWDMVTLDAWWLAIKAVAGSAKLAYAMADWLDWETELTVCADEDATFEWTADANFAKANRWTTCDLVWATQLIDLWATVTNVFKVLPSVDAWTVWATTWVKVKINAFLF